MNGGTCVNTPSLPSYFSSGGNIQQRPATFSSASSTTFWSSSSPLQPKEGTSHNGYWCICPLGYNGTRCEHDIRECASQPCANGGVCLDKIGFYECICAEGYFGKNCEAKSTLKDEKPKNFASVPQRAPCVEESLCQLGYGDETCQSPCNNAPCGWDGGDCLPRVDGSISSTLSFEQVPMTVASQKVLLVVWNASMDQWEMHHKSWLMKMAQVLGSAVKLQRNEETLMPSIRLLPGHRLETELSLVTESCSPTGQQVQQCVRDEQSAAELLQNVLHQPPDSLAAHRQAGWPPILEVFTTSASRPSSVTPVLPLGPSAASGTHLIILAVFGLVLLCLILLVVYGVLYSKRRNTCNSWTVPSKEYGTRRTFLGQRVRVSKTWFPKLVSSITQPLFNRGHNSRSSGDKDTVLKTLENGVAGEEDTMVATLNNHKKQPHEDDFVTPNVRLYELLAKLRLFSTVPVLTPDEELRLCSYVHTNIQEMNQIVSSEGETLLHLAAKQNFSPAVMHALIQEGADLFARDFDGNTPLMSAATTNSLESLQALLEEEMRLMNRHQQHQHQHALVMSTPSFVANNKEISELQPCHHSTASGNTASKLATRRSFNFLATVGEGFAQPRTANASWALMQAIRYGGRDSVQLLLSTDSMLATVSSGVDYPRVQGSSSIPTIQQTASTSVGVGHHLQPVRDPRGRTALHWCSLVSDAVTMGQLLVLPNFRRVIDQVDDQQRSALMYAVLEGSTHCVLLLLHHDADISLLDECGSSCLDLALQVHDHAMYQRLLDFQAAHTKKKAPGSNSCTSHENLFSPPCLTNTSSSHVTGTEISTENSSSNSSYPQTTRVDPQMYLSQQTMFPTTMYSDIYSTSDPLTPTLSNTQRSLQPVLLPHSYNNFQQPFQSSATTDHRSKWRPECKSELDATPAATSTSTAVCSSFLSNMEMSSTAGPVSSYFPQSSVYYKS